MKHTRIYTRNDELTPDKPSLKPSLGACDTCQDVKDNSGMACMCGTCCVLCFERVMDYKRKQMEIEAGVRKAPGVPAMPVCDVCAQPRLKHAPRCRCGECCKTCKQRVAVMRSQAKKKAADPEKWAAEARKRTRQIAGKRDNTGKTAVRRQWRAAMKAEREALKETPEYLAWKRAEGRRRQKNYLSDPDNYNKALSRVARINRMNRAKEAELEAVQRHFETACEQETKLQGAKQ